MSWWRVLVGIPLLVLVFAPALVLAVLAVYYFGWPALVGGLVAGLVGVRLSLRAREGSGGPPTPDADVYDARGV